MYLVSIFNIVSTLQFFQLYLIEISELIYKFGLRIQ